MPLIRNPKTEQEESVPDPEKALPYFSGWEVVPSEAPAEDSNSGEDSTAKTTQRSKS